MNNLLNIININHPRLYYIVDNINKFYYSFNIKKKSGGVRVINAPKQELKIIQNEILLKILKNNYFPNDNVHGFIRNRNILTNSLFHFNANSILNIDIQNYFKNISFNSVLNIINKLPFDFSDQESYYITRLITYNGYLPQGSPSSPLISNMVTQNFDIEMNRFAKVNNCQYSRYADDITISSKLNRLPLEIFDYKKNILSNKIVDIFLKNNFRVNSKKTRVANKKQKMMITGLVVNEFPNIQRKYIRNIRAIIYSIESLGLEKAALKLTNIKNINNYDEMYFIKYKFLKSIVARVEYVGYIKGKDSSVYLTFRKKINQIISNLR